MGRCKGGGVAGGRGTKRVATTAGALGLPGGDNGRDVPGRGGLAAGGPAAGCGTCKVGSEST